MPVTRLVSYPTGGHLDPRSERVQDDEEKIDSDRRQRRRTGGRSPKTSTLYSPLINKHIETVYAANWEVQTNTNSSAT